MKTLDLYIGRGFTRCFLLVLFILAFLFSLFEFFGQLDDVGRGNYQLQDAFVFVLLTLPGRILDLIPGSTLLGGIISLGLLSDNNELMAMQAGGISVKRICWSVIAAAALPILAEGILVEFTAPSLEQHAMARRLAALGNSDITITNGGFWTRKGPIFIHVREIRRGGFPADIDIFEWDQEGRLRVFTHAREADITEDKRWVLRDIEQKTITDQGITAQHLNTLLLESFLSAEEVGIQNLPPESLALSDLYQYTQYLQEGGQNTDQYKMVFWQKATAPLSTVALVLLAVTFVFGPTRGFTAGYRIMMGSTAGIMLHFLNQIIGHFGLLFGINPVVTTMMPITIIFCLALWLLSRGP